MCSGEMNYFEQQSARRLCLAPENRCAAVWSSKMSEVLISLIPNACITNLSSASYTRTLTTWHYPHSPAATCRAAMNLSISPARRAHSSKPAAAGLLLWARAWTDRWTDRRTATVPLT